jgi:hypothetical protein
MGEGGLMAKCKYEYENGDLLVEICGIRTCEVLGKDIHGYYQLHWFGLHHPKETWEHKDLMERNFVKVN